MLVVPHAIPFDVITTTIMAFFVELVGLLGRGANKHTQRRDVSSKSSGSLHSCIGKASAPQLTQPSLTATLIKGSSRLALTEFIFKILSCSLDYLFFQ